MRPRRGYNYHALAAVHHRAKAVAYYNAGFGDKADRHMRRARQHAAFGVERIVDSVDLENMFCTDKDRISRIAQSASELSAYTVLATMCDGNNGSAYRIKPSEAKAKWPTVSCMSISQA